MGILTPFFNLFKPAKTDPQAISKINEDLDIIDSEMHKPPLTVNGISPDSTTRDLTITEVPLAGNLSSDIAQINTGEYIERSSGGEASIEDGDAFLVTIKGNAVHTGFVPESIDMTVNAAQRTAPAAITATLDKDTFEEYVENTPGTYTLTFTDSWDEDPTDYGVTVSNTPVNGDSIVIVWDGENDPTLTVNAVTRPVPPAITATLNRATFVAYVQSSGTITLSYTSSWSADPALYGVTITNTPINGDSIVIVYVKEERGTITPATPAAFVSTGWNLYDNDTGYAKVVRYNSTASLFLIGGTYSLVEFATTVSGTRSALTVSDGYFTIPSNGYVFVTGGNATTYILMCWTDWVNGYEGEFEEYTADTIDLSEVMLNFPYGLLAVGVVRDEININSQTAIQRIQRLEYTDENLAAVIASGMDYDADTNYIYAVLQTPVTTSFTLDGAYTVDDHGIEYVTGTTIPVIIETLYGENLKDKLRTDVVTISQQTLTDAQKEQVCSNLGIERTTLRDVPFAIATSDWTLSSGVYVAEVASDYVTAACKFISYYDKTLRDYAQADILDEMKSGGGGIKFTTAILPTGTIMGTALVFAPHDNKVPTLIENTVTPIANGGTGQSTLAGAQEVLGITALNGNLMQKRVTQICSVNIGDSWNYAILSESIDNFDLLIIGVIQTNGSDERWSYPPVVSPPSSVKKSTSQYDIQLAPSNSCYYVNNTELMAKLSFTGAILRVYGVKL